MLTEFFAVAGGRGQGRQPRQQQQSQQPPRPVVPAPKFEGEFDMQAANAAFDKEQIEKELAEKVEEVRCCPLHPLTCPGTCVYCYSCLLLPLLWLGWVYVRLLAELRFWRPLFSGGARFYV